MPIEKFSKWVSKVPLRQSLPLSTLKDATIGIDASFYLDLALANNEEYLLNAHGGYPFTLERELEDDIKALQAVDARVIFVFTGLSHINTAPSAATSTESRRAVENGFIKVKNKDEHDKITYDFAKARYPLDVLHRYLQNLLAKYEVEYIVAPYSAIAQLAYMLHSSEQIIDCIMGSVEQFLFGVDKVITKFVHGKDISSPSFDFITKASCEERLKATPDLLRDAQLILGSSFTVTFPPLEAQAFSKLVTIQDAINMLNTAQRSVMKLCQIYSNDQAIADLDYPDRYKKALMTIRHHIFMQTNGTVGPLDFHHAPGDLHEFVGQSLPEELFFYISRGLLGPNVPNWLTHGEIVLTLPNGVLDSEVFRRLAVDQLNTIRAYAIKLVAEQLHFYYSTRVVKVQIWDNRTTDDLTITLREIPELRKNMSCWTVHGNDLTNAVPDFAQGPIVACLKALSDRAFAKKTTKRQSSPYPAIKTAEEILANTLWRFLQLRGYISETHEVTKWGRVLQRVLEQLGGTDTAESNALLAVELLRLGLFNGNEVDGTLISSTDGDFQHKSNTNLVSKVACLGKYRHRYGVGYVGTLDRSLLAFAWTVTLVRSTLRDLVESVVTAMFLSGEVERDRKDYHNLAASLPLLQDQGAPLGIMTKTYLDALKEDTSSELKEKIKNGDSPYDYFGELKHGTLNKSLDNGWKIWDAVVAGAELADVDSKPFEVADEWLKPRR